MLLDLKQIRIESGKTLEEISSNLKIRKQYLIALEEGDFESIPGKVYAKGYLKLYANYLGITVQSDLVFDDKNITHKKIISRDQQDKIFTEHKYKKYLIIISIIMLLMVLIMYHVIL